MTGTSKGSKATEDQIRDEVLRRMLTTPHKPHVKPKTKAKRKSKKGAGK